jgi:hypothetical protein
MAWTASSFDNLLKRNYYGDVNRDLLERDNEAVGFVLRNKVFDGGQRIQAPVRVRRAAGSTHAQSETGGSPTAAQPVDTTAYDNMKFIYTNKEISQHLVNSTKASKYAYMKAVDDMVQDALGEQSDHIERHLFTVGSGALCAMSGAGTSSTVLNVATDFNFDMLYVGQVVDVFNTTLGTVNDIGVDGDIIASFDASAYTVTLTTGVADYASLSTSYSLFAGNTRSGTTNYSFNSLNDLCGTGSIHGITTTAGNYVEYVGYVQDLAGAALELKHVQKQIDETEKKNKGKIGMILSHDTILRNYQFDLIDPRVVQDPGDGLGGTGKIYFKGRSKERIELVSACYANPINRMWFIDKNAIQMHYTSYVDWCQDDHGHILHKKSAYPLYEALLGSEFNLIAFARYRLGYIDQIT